VLDFMPATAQLRRQRDRLQALVGQRVTAGWTGWLHDRLVPGAPVVLAFDGGEQLELAWQKWDDLSVTWNTVDPAEPCGYEWRPAAPAEMAAIIDLPVTAIAVSEGAYFNDADLLAGGPLPMDAVAGWVVDGLWLETGETGLLVHNGADTVALSPSPMIPTHDGLARTSPLDTFPASPPPASPPPASPRGKIA
jgi:hypothetical protein